MEQRDYLKRQIESVGAVLGGILLLLTGKKLPEGSLGRRQAFRAMKEALDWDMDALLSLPEEDFVRFFSERGGMDEGNWEKFVQVLVLLGDSAGENREIRLALYRKALAAVRFLNRQSLTFSLERMSWENRIGDRLASEGVGNTGCHIGNPR